METSGTLCVSSAKAIFSQISIFLRWLSTADIIRPLKITTSQRNSLHTTVQSKCALQTHLQGHATSEELYIRFELIEDW